MTKTIGTLQLGKNGITDNFIKTLKNNFVNCKNIKVSVLRSASRDKKKIKEFSSEIISKLGNNYTARVIGFTIVIKRWRKNAR